MRGARALLRSSSCHASLSLSSYSVHSSCLSTGGPRALSLVIDARRRRGSYLHGAEIMGMLRNAMEENQIQAAVRQAGTPGQRAGAHLVI